MYRYHHYFLPPGLPNNKFTIQSDIHKYNTRQALDLHIDPTNTKLAKNTIKTQDPMIWNSINKTIKNCNSLVSFKKSLNKFILAQYECNVTTNKYATLNCFFFFIFLKFFLFMFCPAPLFQYTVDHNLFLYNFILYTWVLLAFLKMSFNCFYAFCESVFPC